MEEIKAKVEEIVNKIKGDSGALEKFKGDPAGTVKGLLGNIELPKEQIEKIVEGVKAKISLDDAGSAISGAVDKVKDGIGGLFGKK